jgi:hypothetical protein
MSERLQHPIARGQHSTMSEQNVAEAPSHHATEKYSGDDYGNSDFESSESGDGESGQGGQPGPGQGQSKSSRRRRRKRKGKVGESGFAEDGDVANPPATFVMEGESLALSASAAPQPQARRAVRAGRRVVRPKGASDGRRSSGIVSGGQQAAVVVVVATRIPAMTFGAISRPAGAPASAVAADFGQIILEIRIASNARARAADSNGIAGSWDRWIIAIGRVKLPMQGLRRSR